MSAASSQASEDSTRDSDAPATFVVPTMRSHPRPGSNSDGLLVFASKGGGGGSYNEDGVAPTLGAHGSRNNAGAQPPAIAFHPTQDPIHHHHHHHALGADESGSAAVMTDSAVRRLTPRECEHLQGFPDDWTQLGGTPDSARYGGLGDAVTVPVAEWIGRRIALTHHVLLDTGATSP